MIPSNFRIEILEICALLCALGTKGLMLNRQFLLGSYPRFSFSINLEQYTYILVL